MGRVSGLTVDLVLGLGVALAAVAGALYALVLLRGRRLGTRGVVQRSHLACPKCGGEFDYDWVPGASLTAARLGPWRYMACPRCRRWSAFPVFRAMVARPAGRDETPHDASGRT